MEKGKYLLIYCHAVVSREKPLPSVISLDAIINGSKMPNSNRYALNGGKAKPRMCTSERILGISRSFDRIRCTVFGFREGRRASVLPQS